MSNYAWLTVRVTLDPIPGMFHTAEDARRTVENRLKHMLPPTYDPVVEHSAYVENKRPNDNEDSEQVSHHNVFRQEDWR